MTTSTGLPSPRRRVERLPFANETQVHTAFEKEVNIMFGGQIVASARRGGGRLFDIDILAIDRANTPIIVECKWDLVDQHAIAQLRAYRSALKKGWRSFEKRVGEVRGRTVRLRWREPVLVAVGYRVDPALESVAPNVRCLAYTYHGISVGSGPIDLQAPGAVSFANAAFTTPRQRHPKVSKKSATHRRLMAFSDSVRRAFWEIDQALRNFSEVDEVEVTYGGKNFVRYRTPQGRFAEAVIGEDSIDWNLGDKRSGRQTVDSVKLVRASDKKHVIGRIRSAYDSLA